MLELKVRRIGNSLGVVLIIGRYRNTLHTLSK